MLAAHMAWLSERAPQVNYSATILHRELRDQRGFAGCYELVKVGPCGHCVPRHRPPA